MNMAKFGWAAALAAAVVVAACGGGGDSAPVTTTVVAQDVTVPATKNTVAVLSDKALSFPPVPALGTTASTTLVIKSTVVGTGTSAALGTPTFSISSGGNTASGTMSFGSCIFIITSSTFQGDHPLAAGKTLTVNPCEADVDTEGQAATGTATVTAASLQLGNTSSQPVNVPVTIAPTGAITFTLPDNIATQLPSEFKVETTAPVTLVTGGA